MRRWMRESAGWMLAACVAVITAATVASTPRSDLLFRDGDSLVVALISRSLLDGGPQDWAMSSVLFIPETVVLVALDAALPLDVEGVLAVNAVVNLLALYGALRLAAGRSAPGAAPVAWSLGAFLAFCLIAATERSVSRDALELASLQLTTTYYAATVVAVVATIGLLRRTLDHGSRSALAWIVAVAALSTLSNPLFAVWAAAPLAALLAIGAARPTVRRRHVVALGALLGGTALGLLLRIPLSAWIANSGAGYVQPERWAQSLEYYVGLLGARIPTPQGLFGSFVTAVLLVLAIWLSVAYRRRMPSGALLVVSASWAIPLIVVVGAIAAGTHAARYLQPLAFAPVLALTALPGMLRLPLPAPELWKRRGLQKRPELRERHPERHRLLVACAAAVLLAAAGLGAGLSIPRLHAATAASDPDLACVTEWVEASDRTGAGQFWTVRLPKLHIDDPAQLVQVDHQLRGYAWLVNRADFEVGAVSFLVQDAQSVPWDVTATPAARIDCGRYTILDFGEQQLRLGPQRS